MGLFDNIGQAITNTVMTQGQTNLQSWDKSPSNATPNDGVTNPNYRIWLTKTVNGQTLTVSTPMPENWSIQLGIPWASQFSSALQSVAGNIIGQAGAEAIANVTSAIGYQVQNKTLSAQIWGGTANIEIQVPFVLKAESNPQTEVVEPISNMMLMALPSVSNAGMLKAPYSALADSFAHSTLGSSVLETLSVNLKNGPCSVRFGKFFKLDNCVITQISQSYDSIFDANGVPLSCKVDLNICSTFIITCDDMPNILKGTSGGTAGQQYNSSGTPQAPPVRSTASA